MQTWSVGALPLHREPLLPCVAILCVDLSQHDKFVQVKNKALASRFFSILLSKPISYTQQVIANLSPSLSPFSTHCTILRLSFLFLLPLLSFVFEGHRGRWSL